MTFSIVFCKGKRITTKQPNLDPLVWTETSSRKWWKHGCGLGGAGGARTRGPNNNYSLEEIMFNNNNNNHFTRTLSVLTSARVFMRRQPIPPLCGGAVQALPNIQTTLRDHPHPASRPMTLGHFTSWRADDRGYYSRHMHLLYIIYVVYETYDTHERDRTVGHIFGARAGGFSIFFEKVVRFHMFYWHRILKLLKLHCVWKDFDMRARRPRACALCVIFCKGWWPWHVRNRCCRSSKSVKKLLAKALFTEMFKKWWV